MLWEGVTIFFFSLKTSLTIKAYCYKSYWQSFSTASKEGEGGGLSVNRLQSYFSQKICINITYRERPQSLLLCRYISECCGSGRFLSRSDKKRSGTDRILIRISKAGKGWIHSWDPYPAETAPLAKAWTSRMGGERGGEDWLYCSSRTGRYILICYRLALIVWKTPYLLVQVVTLFQSSCYLWSLCFAPNSQIYGYSAGPRIKTVYYGI
jgi:hypothetical protein